MSENTSVILIRASNIVANDLKEVIKDKGFVFPINETWTVLTIKNGLKKGKSCSKTLSQHFNTSVLTYDYNEDYFWQVALFQEGKEQASILMDFEEDEVRVLSTEIFCEALFTPSQFETFIAQLEEEDYLSAIDEFKKNLVFEKVEWLSYEYLEEWESKDYENWRVTFLHRRKVNRNKFQNLIQDAYNEILTENGYSLAYTIMDNDLFFRKYINGYKYTIKFEIDGRNEFRLSCLLPYFMWEMHKKMIEQKCFMRLNFKTQKQLKQLINTEGKEFISRAIAFLQEHAINIPNGSFYNETSDQLLKSLGFEKVHVDEDIEHGGKAKYSNGEVELTFVHPEGSACIDRLLMYNRRTEHQIDFISIIHKNCRYFGYVDTGDIIFAFRSVEEFYMQFQHLISLLKKYLDEREYQFV